MANKPVTTANRDPGKSAAKKTPKRRRVIVPPPEGSEPNPEGEPERFRDDDNDERLRRDVPPHWG